MNPSFELALRARLAWMHAGILGRVGLEDELCEQACQTYWYMEQLARIEGGAKAHYAGRIPPLFLENPDLVDAYQQAQELVRSELAMEHAYEDWAAAEKALELREQEQQRLDAERIEACLVACDWEGLALPSPADLLSRLLAHERVRVNHHSLVYEDGWTWMTNPYGIDGVLSCRAPTLQACHEFLVRMARDEDYGPVP